jgi:hypothetical protein
MAERERNPLRTGAVGLPGISPPASLLQMLQEAPGEAAPAIFLFVVTAAGKATYGILYLVERATAFAAGKPPGEAAHCVLHLIDGSATFTTR